MGVGLRWVDRRVEEQGRERVGRNVSLGEER